MTIEEARAELAKIKEQTGVSKLTVEQARERLAEIKKMAKAGDFSYSFDEYLMLCNMVPEEKAACDKAADRQKKNAQRRAKRMGWKYGN